MARILWVNHPTDPRKNSATEHVSREAAQAAIAFGYAQAAPFRNYIERLDEDQRQRTAAEPKALQQKESWSVRESNDGQSLTGIVVTYVCGTTTMWYTDVPEHAPRCVHEQAKVLKAKLEQMKKGALDLERLQREQKERESKENALARGVGLPPSPPPDNSWWKKLLAPGEKPTQRAPEPEPIIKGFI